MSELPDLSQESFISRIESAIEASDLAAARQLLEEVVSYYGPQPAFEELRSRVEAIERERVATRVRSTIETAQAAIRRASYQEAIAELKRGLEIAPDDAEVREILDQTEKAAERHRAAVERNRAVVTAAQRIDGLLSQGRWDTARVELQQAGAQYGRHGALIELQKRLEELAREAELERTVARVDQLQALVDSKNWRGAIQEAERALKRDPENDRLRELLRYAKAELDREESQRLHAADIEQARQGIERLITANELDRANKALAEAFDRLGRADALVRLETRISDAKASLRARQRHEWAERRLKEAESLVREAGRLSLKGLYQEAIEHLQNAQKLDPNHTEIEGMLTAARAARDKQLAEESRQQIISERKAEIRRLLDDLELEDAERRIRESIAETGNRRVFAPLRSRLAELRETQRVGTALSTAASSLAHGESLDSIAEAEALVRQQALAAAYGWADALLYPFRGRGIVVTGVLFVLLVAFEMLRVSFGSLLLTAARWLMPVVVLGFLLGLVRATLLGQNQISEKAARLRDWPLDLLVVLAGGGVTGLPLAVFVLLRNSHGWLDVRSPYGWWVLALGGWLTALAVVVVCGAAGAFGRREIFRVLKHLRAVWSEPDISLAAHLVFVVALFAGLLRVLPALRGMAVFVASALEAWALLAIPHVIGFVMRRHRIELAKLYS